MKGQMTLFDLMTEEVELDKCINPPEPLCYSCDYAIRRGPFRLCQKGRKGYKKIGQEVSCKIYTTTDS